MTLTSAFVSITITRTFRRSSRCRDSSEERVSYPRFDGNTFNNCSPRTGRGLRHHRQR